MSIITNTTSPWISCYEARENAKIRLICIPHGGGGPHTYKEWAEKLPDFIEVYALCFPGRGSRRDEDAICNMFELSDEISNVIAQISDKPYAIFGHSVGALVAYEVAKEIEKQGIMPPLRLILSAHKTPEDSKEDEPMYMLSDEDLMNKILELGLLPNDVLENKELLDFILPPLRADFELSETYEYEKSKALNIPITATFGKSDPLLNGQDIQKWEKYTNSEYKIKEYDGDHFYTLSKQDILFDDIVKDLKEDLKALPLSIMEGESAEYPKKCLHELFKEQAQKNPEKIAVLDVNKKISFKELDEQTDLLARKLQTLGLGVDDIGGIYTQSSIEYIIAYLGILKAGGAYMPLEIAYPKELLKKALNKAKPKVIVSTNDYIEFLPENEQIVCLDENWQERLKKENLPKLYENQEKPNIDSLAYCVMTSGTTGEPKGIICPHRGAVNSYYWRYNYYPYEQNEREACNVFFVWEAIRALLQGFPTYVIPDSSIYDPWKLVSFLEEHKITRVLFTPSLLEQILNTPNLDLTNRLSSLKIVWLNGEVVPTVLRDRFFEVLPDCKLLNDYSVSETHDICTYDLALLDKRYSPKFSSVGKAMSNVRVYLLDEEQKPVPQGVSGEIYVAGDSLARGYLGDKEKTDERFIKDTIKNDGSIMFRSGDGGRLLPNGELEITGRLEFMIKLRGYTVVPGAVEAAINEHSGINSCVLVTKDNPQTKQPEALVSYLVSNKSMEDNELIVSLREYLKENLPHYEVPSYLIVLDELPLNSVTGKLDRKKLPNPDEEVSKAIKNTAKVMGTATEEIIVEVWQEVLGTPVNSVKDNFFDLGGHSLLGVKICFELSQRLNIQVSVIDIFDKPTVQSLAALIESKKDGSGLAHLENITSSRDKNHQEGSSDLAIIGMAGIFPGAKNIDEFWDNICNKHCAIKELSKEYLESIGVSAQIYEDENYRPYAAIIDEVEFFDPQFWNLSKKESVLMDPQHRLFLQTCYHALENAGIKPGNGERTGVFGGSYSPLYLLHQLGGGGFMDPTDPMEYHLTETGNDKDYLTTRVSYMLDLQGPSIAVQTSCSTALSVISSACQALELNQCDIALAGASSITFPQGGYQYVEGHINSKDGKVRTFDEKASGTILGDGVGVVVLKRLDDALRDKDTIYSVIKGYATNNDGIEKAGYSAPAVKGQQIVVKQALENANVSADTISFIETHGTGTLVGDPIEIRALSDVYEAYTDKKQYCALGSVKPNIGHSNIAAGMASIMKASLSLYHKTLVPNINYDRPNPAMDIENSPFYVSTELKKWEVNGDFPRRAGVSCLGIGGTNNHFILEEAPEVQKNENKKDKQDKKHNLFLLSAKSENSLKENALSLANFIEKNPDISLDDIEYTLRETKLFYEYRLGISCTDRQSAIKALRNITKASKVSPLTSKKIQSDIKNVFIFSGQGSQHEFMGLGLYENEPRFKKYFDECCEILQKELGIDFKELLFKKGSQAFEYAYYTQPLIVAHQYSITKTLMDWGIMPDGLAGHSIGEYTAALISGIFTLEDTLKLVIARGKEMEKAGKGTMLSASMPLQEAKEILKEHNQVSLAVINTPQSIVFSGEVEPILKLQEVLEEKEIKSQKVNVSQAFHSPMMAEASQELTKVVKKLKRNKAQIPLMSNVTGTWMSQEQVNDDEYWGTHMRECVYFSDNIEGLLAKSPTNVIEVGASTILTRAMRSFTEKLDDKPLVLPSSRHAKDTATSDTQALDNVIAQIWASGREVDWSLYNNYKGNKIALPGYSFEKVSCWANNANLMSGSEKENKDEMIKDVSNRGFIPSWTRSVFPSVNDDLQEQKWLIFAKEDKISDDIIKALKDKNASVEVVYPQDLKIDDSNSFAKLFDTLNQEGKYPNRILYLWTLGINENVKEQLDMSFYPLLNFTKGLAAQSSFDTLRVWILTDYTFNVNDEKTNAVKSTLFGPSIVLPQEYSQIECRMIDVLESEISTSDTQRRILNEISAKDPDIEPFIAIRGIKRWVKRYEKAVIAPVENKDGFKQDGVYIITGGLGRIARSLSEKLATINAKIILTTRGDAQSESIKEHIKELESKGAKVHVLQANMAKLEDVQNIVDVTIKEFGKIDGIFHLAGLADLRYLPDINKEICELEFNPKIYGVLNLEQVLSKLIEEKNIKPDFVMMFSSLASILGGYSMTAYTAANRFMDTFTQINPYRLGIKWLCTNWDDWDFEYSKEQVSAYEQTVAKYSMSPEDGIESIKRIISMSEPLQILISTREMNPRVEQWLHQKTRDEEEQSENNDEKLADDLVQRISEIYKDVLSMPELSDDDNFFSVGGDSLIASQILLKLRRKLKEYSSKLTLASVFDYPSVLSLANWLKEE
ncbi:MAG: SDR family NAD(P)-dependent oxidoreductase [Arcobacter sp.]|nr:SDR family NAD(P)-dependent oxidoreductase [Arcobacter sp.]